MRRKLYLFLLTSYWWSLIGHTQNVAINTTGTAAGSANMFEVTQANAAANMVAVYAINSSVFAGTEYGFKALASGASTTNIAGYFSATNGTTNNYAGIFDQGNVGIGITSPVYKLDILTNLRISSAGQNSNIQMRGGSDGTNSSSLYLYNPANQLGTLLSDGTYNSYINAFSTTNLGVGTSTPTAKLEVNGTMRIIGPSGRLLFDIGAMDATLSGIAMGYGTTYNGTAMTNSGFLQAETQGTTYRSFLVNPLGGNVCIGTTVSAGKLTVAGNVQTNAACLSPGIWMENSVTGTAGGIDGILSRGTLIAPANNYWAAPFVSNLGTYNTGAGLTGLAFYCAYLDAGSWTKTGTGTIDNAYALVATAPSIGTNNYAAIFTGGNVGIGLTNPTAKLQVAGGILRTNTRMSNSQVYPTGHGGDPFYIDPTWSNSELQAYFNSANVQWYSDATAPAGSCIQITGSVNVGGAYNSGVPYIPIDQNASYYMECWIKSNVASAHYMGSIEYDENLANPSGNPGSYGYWVMSNTATNSSWVKVSATISGFGGAVGQFQAGKKYWTPLALFNYGFPGSTCYISGWRVTELKSTAVASGSGNYIQNQTAADQVSGFRINGNGLFNGGSVGIGTTSPGTLLEVKGTGASLMRLTASSGRANLILTGDVGNTQGPQILFQKQNVTEFAIYDYNGAAKLTIWDAATGNDAFSIMGGKTTVGNGSGISGNSSLNVYGNAGIGTGYIGTAAPANGLIVEGNVGIGVLAPGRALEVVGSGVGQHTAMFKNTGLYGIALGACNGQTYGSIQGTSTALGTNTNMVLQESGGNVGIATNNPAEKLEVNGNIKFTADASIISKAPYTVHSTDPNAGCPGARAANTDLWTMSITLTRSSQVLLTGDIIRYALGRADLQLYIDGGFLSQTATNTGTVTDWVGAHVQWTGTIAAGTHTVSLRSPVANVWGCTGTWGSMDAVIFEH